jgi:aminoglycoside phosphotransferase (APT) family kinase protein
MMFDNEPIQINIQAAERIIAKQFKQEVNIEYLGEGWDNIVYLVNKEFVFRFPRRKIAVQLIEREWNILPNLKDKLNLKIPLPIFKGVPSSEYEFQFI